MTMSRHRSLPARLLAVAALATAPLALPLASGGAEAHAAEREQTKKNVAVRGATWYVRTSLSGGTAEHEFSFGRSSDEAILGDWNASERPSPGAVRGNRFYLNNTLDGGTADLSFTYGHSSDTPLVGDWNGDGRETVGVRRGATFLLRNSHAGGQADIAFSFGWPSDTPVVGDWNGDGRDTVGVRRGSRFYLRDRHAGGTADRSYAFGRPDDEPVTGDWDGDGRDTVGVVRGNTYYLTEGHSGGEADRSFTYGNSSDDALLWSASFEAEPAPEEPEEPEWPFSVPEATWDALAECESNGNWSLNTGNGYYGGLQFDKSSWDWAGGQTYAEWPHRASRMEQIAVAEELLSIHPAGWGAWPYCSDLLGLR